ncbi:hypothetical protein [Spirochaeta cellobiosiphila]|uniref:hypothetical protein n=1 Tax=Spirochaeta cellobiosiphila TaxID=504483 RepID=UPI00041303C8|nr:hypothetical protein [Spirochaeta cellobiosiphila]
MAELIGVSEFANRKKVTRQAVYKALSSGRIEYSNENPKKIDWELMSYRWEERDRPSTTSEKTHGSTKKEKEYYDTQLKKLEYEEKSGTLITKETVEDVLFDFTHRMKELIMAIPIRSAPRCQSVFVDYVDSILGETLSEKKKEEILERLDVKAIERLLEECLEPEMRSLLETASEEDFFGKDS